MDAVAVREIPVFSAFDESQCEQIASACQELEVEAGKKLTEEGDFGYAMFAVLEGTADVTRNGSYIRTLGPGDVFGEIAVFFGGQRTATITATSPMRLVMLFNQALSRLDHDVPELANELRKGDRGPTRARPRLERENGQLPEVVAEAVCVRGICARHV